MKIKKRNVIVWDLYRRAYRLAGKLAESVIARQDTDPELAQWQEESVEAQKLIRAFSDPELCIALLAQFEKAGKEVATKCLHQAIRKRRQVKFIRRISAVAAIVLLLAGSSVFIYPFFKSSELPIADIVPGERKAMLVLANGEKINLEEMTRIRETDGTDIKQLKQGEVSYHAEASGKVQESYYNTIIVPRYGEYSVVLSDGTRIKLNSESEIRYPTTFSDTLREVFLKGEAYLEVSKSERPFIVHTYDAQIKVYGTRFDINSYNPEHIYVVLAEGKVGIRNTHSPEILLSPNQLAQIDARHGITIKKEINPEYYIAWQNGYFAFEKEKLEDILITLSRWYNFDVLYSKPELKDICFTASLKRDQPLKDILQQFQKTGSLSFRINGNQIIIQ